MTPFKRATLTLLAIFLCHWVTAQESEVAHSTEEAKEHRHMISLQIGHTHLSEGVKNGEKQWLNLPSWALDYNYLLKEDWILGLHTELIIENFEVRSRRTNEETIERTRPLSIVGVAGYKPIPRLAVLLGGGFEYSKEETFGLIRIGVEPSIEISHRWEIVFSMVYDIKLDAYNSWAIGAGVARLF